LVDVRGIYPRRGSHYGLHGSLSVPAHRLHCVAAPCQNRSYPSPSAFVGMRHMLEIYGTTDDDDEDIDAYERWNLGEVVIERGRHILVRTVIRKYPWPFECARCAVETMQIWIDLDAPPDKRRIAPASTKSLQTRMPVDAGRFDLLRLDDVVVEVERAEPLLLQVVVLADYVSAAHKDSLRRTLMRTDPRLRPLV
jgi:hypothetical protein